MTATNDDAHVPGADDLSPPKGYENWLEYAVAMFDAKRVLGPAFDDADRTTQRQVQAGVWAEFNLLRSRAGLPALEPKGLMLDLAQAGPRALAAIQRKAESEAAATDPQISAEHDPRSLLDTMDKMPRSDGIEFDPPNIVLEPKIVDFDSKS